jgi:predicted PhzF superfamily epimerase YddE/YHI9
MWVVDAFYSGAFTGNPAAVCPLERWLDDPTLQAIAAQNNLSETAFLVRRSAAYHIRWFTPTTEVPLCGHATLASAYVVREFLQPGVDPVKLLSASGELRVLSEGKLLVLDFPAERAAPAPVPAGLGDALGLEPLGFWDASPAPVALLETEADVRRARVVTLLPRLAITAAGDEVDFVSRFFAPGAGIAEDPVTGAAHCALTPFWARRLGRSRLHARQLSPRGGELFCEDRGERVRIGGRARLYLRGEIEI